MRLKTARPTRRGNGSSERARGLRKPASLRLAPSGMPAALLSLQRLAGNHATRRLIQRSRDDHAGGAGAGGGSPKRARYEATRLGAPILASRPLDPFGSGLMDARWTSAAVDWRCPATGPCPHDSLTDQGGAALTTCYTNTGKMVTTNLVEHCGGDCVARHEAIHHDDRRECCARVKRCRDLAGGDAAQEAACKATIDAWYPRLSDWTECNAYRAEITCLTNFIESRCDPSEGFREIADDFFFGVSSACCEDLKRDLDFATRLEQKHCAAAVEAPCPFQADGTR